MPSARIWRERNQRYLSEAASCDGCGAKHFPPRKRCDACGGQKFTLGPMASTGTLLTYTVIRTAPPGFANMVPYVVGVLEMDDGTRLMAQVADVAPEEVSMGMKVTLEFRKIRQEGRTGIIGYGHKVVPV